MTISNIFASPCSLWSPEENCVQPGKHSRIWYFCHFLSGFCYCFLMFWRWNAVDWNGKADINACSMDIVVARTGSKNERKHPDVLLYKMKTIVVHWVSLPNIFITLTKPACCIYLLTFLHVKYSARDFSTFPGMGREGWLKLNTQSC